MCGEEAESFVKANNCIICINCYDLLDLKEKIEKVGFDKAVKDMVQEVLEIVKKQGRLA
jgi:hypothetical protein